MKNKKIQIIFFIISFLIIVLISLSMSSFNKLVFFNRAADNQLNIKIKLQGEYVNITGATFKTKVVLYNQFGLVKEYLGQILTKDNQSVFKLTLDTTGINLNQMYAVYIKPEKYLGKLFCSPTLSSANCVIPQIIITSGITDIDLTQDLFLSGDISPQDGRIAADDISKIMNQVGQVSTSYLATDINSDGMVQTVDYSLALYSLSKNYVDDSIPSTWVPALTPTPTPTTPPGQPTFTPVPTVTITLTLTPTPTQIPTLIPTRTPTPTPTPTIGQIRPGKNVEEVISAVSRMACVPKPLLYAILRNESGTRYDSMSQETFVLYNTYSWWKSDKITSKINQICNYTAFNQKTGIIPLDSKFGGELCWIGDITDSMGPMSISSWVWNSYTTRLTNLLGQSTFDRRVIFDSLLGAALHLKNVSLYPGSDCNHWELKYVAKASCKYLSMCEYSGFGTSVNYCVNSCNYYNQYSSSQLDCSQTMSVITNDCQFK